jgi:hypothetical protein
MGTRSGPVRVPSTAVAAPGAADSPSAATVALLPYISVLGAEAVGVVERGGEVERFVAGPLRCEVTANQVTFADDRFAFGIIAVTRAKGGWLFVAADGAVARADSFLGPLRPLGHVPRAALEMSFGVLPPSAGRLAVLAPDPRESLWTTDGSSPVAPARGVPGDVLSVAFADADHGMVVIEGGELFATRDGAASFERVDLGDVAAAAVAHVDGGLVVTTSAGFIAFDREGKLVGPVSTSAVTPARLNDHVPEEWMIYRRILAASFRRHGALMAESLGGVVAADGRVLVPVDHELKSLDEASDAEVAARQSVQPCLGARWGGGVALVCEDGLFSVAAATQGAATQGATTPGATTPGAAVVRRATWNEWKAPRLSEDGIHAAWLCGSRQDALDELCMVAGGRETRRPLGDDRLIGSHGDEVVVRRSSPAAHAVVLIDAATGEERRSFAVRVPPGAPSVADDAWQVTPDGTVFATARAPSAAAAAPGESWLIRVALADGAVAIVRLPDGATRSGFISAARGVAANDDAARLWFTDDGGAHWREHEALPAPYHYGGAYAASWMSLRCSGSRCVIDKRVVIAFDRSLSRGNDRVVASPSWVDVPPTWPDGAALACSAREVARRAGAGGDASGPLDARGNLHLRKVNADVTLHVIAGGRWEAAWRGQDSVGPFSSRRAAGHVAPRGADGDHCEAHPTREGLMMACYGETRRIVWMPVPGRPSVIEDEHGSVMVEDALALPGGRLAVLLLVPAEHLPVYASYHRLVLVGRDGKTIAERTYYWSAATFAGIALSDGMVGIELTGRDPTGSRWFVPIALSAPIRELARLDLASTPICGVPARTTSAVSITVEEVELEERFHDGMIIARVYLRDEGRPCIQAIELREPSLSEREAFLAAAHGDLRTALDLGDAGVRELRCRVTAARDRGAPGLDANALWEAWTAESPPP